MKGLDVHTRIQLRNILFATDFSLAAGAAAPYAAELARHYGARLYALHVRPPAVDPLAPPESWNSLEEAAKIEAEREKRELIEAFTGVQPQVLISEGDLWSTLAAALKENEIDLIVIGTRGRSGIRKFLLGSVAERIFRQAPCPVLTVGPHSMAESRQSGQFTRILFAADFSPESIAAAPFAVSLAQEYQARLTLLHVLPTPKAGALAESSVPVASSMQGLRKLVPPEAEPWCAPDYVVEWGEASGKILEIATQRQADLIVLGVRQPAGFLGAATHLPMATAHKIVSRANCPVLTVRA